MERGIPSGTSTIGSGCGSGAATLLSGKAADDVSAALMRSLALTMPLMSAFDPSRTFKTGAETPTGGRTDLLSFNHMPRLIAG